MVISEVKSLPSQIAMHPNAIQSTDLTSPTGGVSLRQVTKRYGTVAAVEDLSLDIAPGSYTCLLGPSGCGKTTTLRMIAGHETISSGEIRIGDRRVNDLPAAQRNTAMVFQNYALFPHKTVLDNVAFGLKMRNVPKAERQQRTAQMLALVGLEDFAQRKPAQLSGGQQQRVALARALVTRPQVLLLDEPLSALDESLRVKTRSELRKLQRQFGLTFIQVTHAQDEAFSLSDRVVVMNQGRIDQVGKPTEIFNRPASQFVAKFVGDNNILIGTVVSAETQGDHDEIELQVEGLGPIYCQGNRLPPGQVAACSVRGDQLQLIPETEATSRWRNRCQARVSNVEFTGFVSRITLLSEPSGHEFLFKIRTDDWLRSGYQESDLIQLGWTVEDCVFLPH